MGLDSGRGPIQLRVKSLSITLLNQVFYFYPLLLLALIWEIGTALELIGDDVLPRLDFVLISFWQGLSDGDLLKHTAISLFRVLSGLIISFILGVALGLLTGLSRRWDSYLMPLLVGTQAVPRSALLPLFIVWLGFGETQKLVVIVSVAFFPIMINTYEGLKRVNECHIWAARSMGYNDRNVVFLVKIPSVLPYIFSGIRIAVPMSVTMMVIAEMVGAVSGLGQFVIVAGQTYQLAEMFAGIVLLGLMGMLLDRVADYLGRVTMPWRD